MCSNDDWEIIRCLAGFLEVFQKATEILSGSKYPTISLCLLFRAEIQKALEIKETDYSVVIQLKESMKNNLDHRFPIHELYVVAAILDPAQRNLRIINEFLSEHNMTAVDLLSKYIDRYVGASAVSDDSKEHLREESSAPQWKKIKLDLLMKHSSIESTPQREIQQYRCMNVQTDDPLNWWHTQTETYKRLSILARCILAIPASSAPSERVFSIAGVILNSRRSSLSPHVVDKVIFVHENKYLCDNDIDID